MVRKKALLPEVGVEELADLFSLTRRRINLLENEGIITKAERGRYSLRAAVVGYITFLRDENKTKNKTASASDLNRAKAELVKVQVEERTKSLLTAARQEATSAVDMIIGEFRSALDAIPARVTLDVELRRKIEGEIERVYRDAAKTIGRVATGEDQDSDASEASEAPEN